MAGRPCSGCRSCRWHWRSWCLCLPVDGRACGMISCVERPVRCGVSVFRCKLLEDLLAGQFFRVVAELVERRLFIYKNLVCEIKRHVLEDPGRKHVFVTGQQ